MNLAGLPPIGEPPRPAALGLDDGLAFLSRLPLANPLQAEAALDAFLDELTARPPAAAVYLNLLEQARIPLCFVEEELAHRYVGKPLPLGDVEQQAFVRVTGIWRKVTRAYAQCAQLDDDVDDPDHPRRVALILHRCLYYLGMLIVEHHRARHELPAGAWLDLHGYYASAEEWGVATLPVADALDPHGRATHCAAAYAATLLLDLAGPYSLSARDYNLIRRWAMHWAPLVGVVGATADEALPAFVVDVMQDAPLKQAADCRLRDNVRKLDTTRLAVTLAQVRRQLAQRIPPGQIGLGEECTGPQCRKLLEQVMRPWTHARAVRRFRRHASSGVARVAGGFATMHYLIGGAEFAQPASTRMYCREEFDELFSFRHMVDPTAKLQIRQTGPAQRPDDWQVVNQSANGFRLTRSVAGDKVAHGQLLAVCPPDGERYFLAQVTWLMHDRGAQLVAGIAALPGAARAIAARPLTGCGGQAVLFSRAFLLPATDTVSDEPSLVLEAGWFQAGRLLEVHDGQASVQVILLQILQEGPDFERVSFRRDEG
ncbi:hypothetical protein [Azospira restricta]|uniref:Molecular chaperone n=1 Tax=Azospira restricta TaxID=404405 RepID=A0A974SQ13_9RHOO|nr:hypothetical protein [Azospira restricta]QRJ64337.1 hypothetical protein IWH25_03015 [Azospira restricta]